MKAFMWRGTEVVSGGHCLVAWSHVQRPRHLGGLGIRDPELFGRALRMRWLWLSRTDPTRPWGFMQTTDDQATTAFFHRSIAIQLGDGRSALFWSDAWLDDSSIAHIAPNLVAAVRPRAINTRSVADAMHNRSWVRDITGAITGQVILEIFRLQARLEDVHLDTAPDRFIWKCNATGTFSTSSAYKAFFLTQTEVLGARQLWNTEAPNKCRFLMWLVLHGRCWTSERLQRHGLRNHGPCALCSQLPEALNHLLLSCVFSREVWFKVLRRLGWHTLAPRAHDTLVDWWLRSRKQIGKPRRHAFDSLVILVTWLLWLERNECESV